MAASGRPQRVTASLRRCAALATLAVLAACSSSQPPPAPEPEPAFAIAVPQRPGPALTAVDFRQVPGWAAEKHADAIAPFLASCSRMVGQSLGGTGEAARRVGTGTVWRTACAAATTVPPGNDAAARAFFERHMQPWIASADGSAKGQFTGYYEPQLQGSAKRGGVYQTPLLRKPASSTLPSRAQIIAGALAKQHLELVWVSDPIDAFFLEIQGAGRIHMTDGRDIRVSYDGQNGHAYFPIGRLLVERGEMALPDVSLQSIRAWLIAHPKQAAEVMNHNPSYVFFRQLPNTDPDRGPPGALGAPLTPLRSIAVDKSFVPMGTPVWIETTDPVTAKPIRQLMMAQDVGGAIKGPVRADIFFGWGPPAEQRAGLMNKPGAAFLLLPRDQGIPVAAK